MDYVLLLGKLCRPEGWNIESQIRDEGQYLMCPFIHREMVWSVPGGHHILLPVVLPANTSCFPLPHCQQHIPSFYSFLEERRHMLNEKTGVRLPISSVDEWMQKESTTLGVASGALVATGLLLRVNINVNIFCRTVFTCKCQLREEKNCHYLSRQ